MATHDNDREAIAGRSNVQDSPALVAYYEALARLNAGAFWTVANKIEPWQPASASVPVIWRYQEIRDHVMRSLDLVTPEMAGRRVIVLENPGRRDVPAAVGWLFSGLQVMRPGEVASAHRHSASALRFIMEGSGAYTIVNGDKLTLERNDFVLTPNGVWHEHGVSEAGTACIWQDGLDIPLVNALEAGCFAVHPDLHQAVGVRVDESVSYWGAAGLRPQRAVWNRSYSPLLKFEWDRTYEALVRYAAASDDDPFDGALMHYTNPVDGKHVMATIGASMQCLRPGFHGKAHRHTGSFLYHAAKGEGCTIVNGMRLDWRERDIFCVPSWAWHEHVNGSETDDAYLFAFSDLPVIEKLGLYREEALVDNGGYQPVSTPLSPICPA